MKITKDLIDKLDAKIENTLQALPRDIAIQDNARYFALVATKLEEAQLWLSKVETK